MSRRTSRLPMTAENFSTRGHSTNIKKPYVLVPALGRMELVRSASGFITAQSSPDIADKTLRDNKINFRMRLCVFNPVAPFAHHSSVHETCATWIFIMTFAVQHVRALTSGTQESPHFFFAPAPHATTSIHWRGLAYGCGCTTSSGQSAWESHSPFTSADFFRGRDCQLGTGRDQSTKLGKDEAHAKTGGPRPHSTVK